MESWFKNLLLLLSVTKLWKAVYIESKKDDLDGYIQTLLPKQQGIKHPEHPELTQKQLRYHPNYKSEEVVQHNQTCKIDINPTK